MGQTDDERAQATSEEHKRQAILHKQNHKVKDAPPVTSKCAQLASTYGVGIGLYFQVIVWLRYLLFWLALSSVPYIIVVNTSKFTTEVYKGLGAAPSVQVLPSFNPLQAFTFAAIMDDVRDNGVLAWMNIQLPGFQGVFTMSRPQFLGWISLVDAASMAVFSVACMVLYKTAARFVQEVDDSTMEVADYTVVIKGLPETTPIDIGKHFGRYGKVMDVVIVKDFGPLLNLAHTATTLEQQRRNAEDRLSAAAMLVMAYQRQVKQQETRMAKFMKEAHEQLDAGFELKAVFVTFSTQVECSKCLADSPRRWLSSWFRPRAERFLGKYRYWVEQAKPPEDYIYENLHYSRAARCIRMAVVRLVVLAILLVSAAAVTKLMAINISAARNIIWSNGALVEKINSNMQVYPLDSAQILLAPVLANATLDKIKFAVGDASSSLEQPIAFEQLTYCSVQLRTRCSERLGSVLKTTLVIEPAERVKFASAADTFLQAKNFHDTMKECSEQALGSCGYSMCYPCYCNILSQMSPAAELNSEWVYSAKQECSTYIETLDVKAAAMKAVISFVIVVLNIILKQILQVLVRFEKHWTQSDQERQYAILAFVSQLLNSVVVLLLVNARSSAASSTINASLSGSRSTSWGANLVLSGAFDDFSAAWYVDVGQSLEIIVIMNAVLTAVFAWMNWLMRKLRQSCLTNCVVTASQSMYNSAWIGFDFVLDYRVSDIMLGLWIILMFGSGMPGLYIFGIIWLFVLDLTDRWYLSIMCKQPVRYGKSLPYLLLGVLPWAAATHCAFGLWMHTHFNAGNNQNLSGLAGSAGSNIAAWANSDMGKRITQSNGLPLLILLIVHLTIHVIIRSLIYFCSSKAFACCCAEEDDGPEIEVTYESALLATYSKGLGRRKLAGTPTYRMPHHPRYKDFFDNAMYKPIWFKAFGRLCFTQLVSRPGGGFQISPEVILSHDETDMEDTLAGMSADLQKLARQLAHGDNADGSKNKRSSLKPRTSVASVIDALRDKNQNVNIAVLAGISSPRTSIAENSVTADSPKLMPRAGSMVEVEPQGSFSVASPRAGSMLAPEGMTMRQQQQSFTVSPSPLSVASLSFPGVQSMESAAQLSGIIPDSILMHLAPSFAHAATNNQSGWNAPVYASRDTTLIPGMADKVQGSTAANSGVECHPPCNLSESSGALQVPPAGSYSSYPPCNLSEYSMANQAPPGGGLTWNLPCNMFESPGAHKVPPAGVWSSYPPYKLLECSVAHQVPPGGGLNCYLPFNLSESSGAHQAPLDPPGGSSYPLYNLSEYSGAQQIPPCGGLNSYPPCNQSESSGAHQVAPAGGCSSYSPCNQSECSCAHQAPPGGGLDCYLPWNLFESPGAHQVPPAGGLNCYPSCNQSECSGAHQGPSAGGLNCYPSCNQSECSGAHQGPPAGGLNCYPPCNQSECSGAHQGPPAGGLNCYPPCNQSECSGAHQVPPAGGLNCYSPCNQAECSGAHQVPPAGGLNCYPPCNQAECSGAHQGPPAGGLDCYPPCNQSDCSGAHEAPPSGGLDCYPPCNLSECSGDNHVPPAGGLQCYQPCGISGPDGAMSAEIQTMPADASLNSLPPDEVVGNGFPVMDMQSGAVYNIAADD